jgi:hypothetical protein
MRVTDDAARTTTPYGRPAYPRGMSYLPGRASTARVVQQMTGTRTIRCAKSRHHYLATTGKLATEVAFRLARSSVHLPCQHPRVGAQIVHMPMSSRSTVEVSVHTRHESAFGTAGIGVIAPWKVSASKTADGICCGFDSQRRSVYVPPGGNGASHRVRQRFVHVSITVLPRDSMGVVSRSISQ